MDASTTIVSSVILREENKVQLTIYCTSHSMVLAGTKYSCIEKLALALLILSRKLKPYFRTHTIIIWTNYPFT